MLSIRMDEYEPTNIEGLLKQNLLVTRASLNHGAKLADYVWSTSTQGYEQAERKTVNEVLSNMERVEYQLSEELNRAPELDKLENLILIVEGVLQPSGTGSQEYIINSNGSVFRKGRYYKTQHSRFMGWLVAQERAGILVWRTSSYIDTADALARFVTSASTLEHSALRRYLKFKEQWSPNPHIQTLMGIEKAEIGPVLGKVLVDIWRTPWNLMQQTAENIATLTPGVGLVKARQILKAFGREDV
jgi:hypothetical protein